MIKWRTRKGDWRLNDHIYGDKNTFRFFIHEIDEPTKFYVVIKSKSKGSNYNSGYNGIYFDYQEDAKVWCNEFDLSTLEVSTKVR